LLLFPDDEPDTLQKDVQSPIEEVKVIAKKEIPKQVEPIQEVKQVQEAKPVPKQVEPVQEVKPVPKQVEPVQEVKLVHEVKQVEPVQEVVQEDQAEEEVHVPVVPNIPEIFVEVEKPRVNGCPPMAPVPSLQFDLVEDLVGSSDEEDAKHAEAENHHDSSLPEPVILVFILTKI
jgi:hypothetical protein